MQKRDYGISLDQKNFTSLVGTPRQKRSADGQRGDYNYSVTGLDLAGQPPGGMHTKITRLLLTRGRNTGNASGGWWQALCLKILRAIDVLETKVKVTFVRPPMHQNSIITPKLRFSDVTLFSSTAPSGISNLTPDLAAMVTLPCTRNRQRVESGGHMSTTVMFWTLHTRIYL